MFSFRKKKKNIKGIEKKKIKSESRLGYDCATSRFRSAAAMSLLAVCVGCRTRRSRRNANGPDGDAD